MDSVLIIGGGPAGMRAAEVASAILLRDATAGEVKAATVLCDAQGSFGRKFLIAGRGGLNLTHSEPLENFPDRYGAEQERWRDLLEKFGPADLEQWANSLGIETYVGSSGRLFPRGQKAAGLLRAWLERLRSNGVEFQTGARFTSLERLEDGWRVHFENGERTAKAVVLALGGASYPETGSDGKWPTILAKLGIAITPWQPANCGWEVDWPQSVLEKAEGKPLKNLTVRAGRRSGLGRIAHHQIWSGRRRDLSARADVAPNERAGADYRFQTATVCRGFARTRFESEAAGGMVSCLEVERGSGRVDGDLREG